MQVTEAKRDHRIDPVQGACGIRHLDGLSPDELRFLRGRTVLQQHGHDLMQILSELCQGFAL